HFGNLWNRQKRFDDVMKQWFSGQNTIIFAGHALAVMTHGHQGNDFGHRGLIIPNASGRDVLKGQSRPPGNENHFAQKWSRYDPLRSRGSTRPAKLSRQYNIQFDTVIIPST